MITILGVIPARGGSKRIPGKNLRHLEGKTLVQWAIDGARESKQLTHIVVSTEDKIIGDEAHRLGIEVLWRCLDLAEDSTPMVAVMRQVAFYKSADYYVCLQPTTPFRSGWLIDQTIAAVQEKEGDSGLTVLAHRPTGEVYVTTKSVLDTDRMLGPRCVDYVWNHGVLNIDTEYDWVRAERIARWPGGIGDFLERGAIQAL